MAKEEVQGYIVMENAIEPMKPKIINRVSEPNVFYVTFETCLQSFDVFNRNRRNYALAPMMQAIQADHIQELLRKGTWVGENGHPDSNDIKRIMSIDPTKICHRICDVEFRGKLLYGTIQSLNDDSWGKQLAMHVLQGMHPSFSLRALAAITKLEDGRGMIKTKPHIVTYDRVILPSHREAYMDNSKPVTITATTESFTVTKESFNPAPLNSFEDYLTPIKEQAISDALCYVKEESKRCKELVEFFDSNFNNVKLINENTVVIDDGEKKLVVYLEDYIQHDISNYFAKIGNMF